MPSLSLGLFVAGVFVCTASAQRLAGYDPLFASTLTEVQPPTVLLPAPNPPGLPYLTVPVLPPPGPFIVAPGDSTFDNRIGLHWFTDGVTLASMATPAWPPLAGPFGPFAIPPVLLSQIGGPVTGIAIDPVGPAGAPIMYMTSAPGVFVGVTLVAGLPVAVLPTPMPFPPGAPITGLEWDGATGTLWAVDITGMAYNFTSAGVAVQPPLPPVLPPLGPAGDIAIDKIGTINAAGLRPLYVAGAGSVHDVRDPAPIFFPSGPPAQGLAFMNHPAEIPVPVLCEGCPGATAGPTAFTTSVMSSGNGGFMVGMGGLAPGVGFGVFAFDSVAAPPPFPPVAGTCPVGLTIMPTLLLVIGGPADPAGNIFFPVSLAGVPVGLFVHNQNFTFCPTQPSGLALSRFQTITSGGF